MAKVMWPDGPFLTFIYKLSEKVSLHYNLKSKVEKHPRFGENHSKQSEDHTQQKI